MDDPNSILLYSLTWFAKWHKNKIKRRLAIELVCMIKAYSICKVAVCLLPEIIFKANYNRTCSFHTASSLRLSNQWRQKNSIRKIRIDLRMDSIKKNNRLLLSQNLCPNDLESLFYTHDGFFFS